MSDDAAALRRAYEGLRDTVRADWDRDLPLDELVSDRWDRARLLGFGEGTSVYATSYIYGDVSVGRDVWIGPLTLLDGTGGLSIGDGTTISAGTQIYTHDTVRRTISGGAMPIERSPVSIGSRTYLGANVIVLRGVRIGDEAVVGAGSLVNRDIPARSVAVGTPAHVIVRVHMGDDGDIELEYF
jgi:acetyltransferase-like isoleucine patch superfamily enzyme